MTWRELLAQASEKLKRAGVAEYELDAWYLFSEIFSISRAEYFLCRDREIPAECAGIWEAEPGALAFAETFVSDREVPEKNGETKALLSRFFGAIGLRSSRIPLQQITGHQEFMWLDFQVNEHVLIPRQDTEVLVETVLNELRDIYTKVCGNGLSVRTECGAVCGGEWSVETECDAECDVADGRNSQRLRILDMCSGSGCIGISLERLAEIPVEVLGTDISAEALAVAKTNSERLGCEHYRVCRSDLFEQIEGTFDVIVSNPPYIPSAVIETLDDEVRLHEPRLALDGEADGLVFYRKIAAEAAKRLNPSGRIYFEIGYDQGAAVSDILSAEGFCDVRVIRDLAGLDRVVTARR